MRMKVDHYLNLFIIILLLSSCHHTSNRSTEYVVSGGKKINNVLCPSAYNDVIVPIDNLKSDPKKISEMTFQSIMEFMDKTGVTSIPELLNALPNYYQNNFSLVEHTRGEGQSDVNFPRIVLFGSDGRFLLNVGTKPEDPKYDLLDGAELNDKTGKWDFSQIDFTGEKPVLHKEPKSCQRCHGSDNPRPIWGSSLDWPGVFGDNEAPGLTGDALSIRHIKRMNEIKFGHGGSARFNFLKWLENEDLKSGGFRRIADNAFGPELLVSNLIIGSAVGRGAFLTIKSKNPDRFADMRTELLLLAYDRENKKLEEQYHKRILSKLQPQDTIRPILDAVLYDLGVDVNELFSLETLAQEEAPDPSWSLGDGDLYEQVYLQVLDDLSKNDSQVRNILSSTPIKFPVFNCPDVVKNIQNLIDYKMLHLYHLKGRARYEVNKVYYPLEAERIYDLVLEPVEDKLYPYLLSQI